MRRRPAHRARRPLRRALIRQAAKQPVRKLRLHSSGAGFHHGLPVAGSTSRTPSRAGRRGPVLSPGGCRGWCWRAARRWETSAGPSHLCGSRLYGSPDHLRQRKKKPTLSRSRPPVHHVAELQRGRGHADAGLLRRLPDHRRRGRLVAVDVARDQAVVAILVAGAVTPQQQDSIAVQQQQVHFGDQPESRHRTTVTRRGRTPPGSRDLPARGARQRAPERAPAGG